MKAFHKLLLFLSFFTMMACEESIVPIVNDSDQLMGSWIHPTPVDTFWRYERASALENTGYGFTFSFNHQFVERKNAGWCGTPPIIYENYEGTWSRNDSIISVSVTYWGGVANYRWKIITMDDHYLTIYKVKEEYVNQN